MKLEAATNEVILSNVGATGEFRIRNSAKAFSILSSGLYSNKIKAIIRELSCNAVDSHVAAGKVDKPFEVHLPSMFEPWFSVRDFGTGLDHAQVTNIYTTYFESTKTESNQFIGALGLGSKSPFSYTENFTVTAIKDGKQRIYSAFINEAGVPSIARMDTKDTEEPNGVEVKFSVTNPADYSQFSNEAQSVFKWFKNKPTVTGNHHYRHLDVIYKDKNIVPGVHYRESNGYASPSTAIMGNIAYSISIPEEEKHVGALAHLLKAGLVIEFDIGDLDFAASREHLSYVPLTINSIKKKLELLEANLVTHITAKVDAINGEWNKALFLYNEHRIGLYQSAVETYVKNSKFKLFISGNGHRGVNYIWEKDMADVNALGITVDAFRMNYSGTTNKIKDTRYDRITSTQHPVMHISVSSNIIFILNDLKTGCYTRARAHFLEQSRTMDNVYCLSHSSKDLVERFKQYEILLKEFHNPPRVMKASDLLPPVKRTKSTSNGLMELSLKKDQIPGIHSAYTWAPLTAPIDKNTRYAFVLLNGHQPKNMDRTDCTDIIHYKAKMDSTKLAGLNNLRIIGVRKSKEAEILSNKNFVWWEDMVKEAITKISTTDVASLVVTGILDSYYTKVYTNNKVMNLVDPSTSLYYKFMKEYGSIKRVDGNVQELSALCSKFGNAVLVKTVTKDIEDITKQLYKKYPMLKYMTHVQSDEADVAEYINLVDKNT